MLLLSLFEEHGDGQAKGVLVLMKRPYLLRDSKRLPSNAETIVLKKAGNQQLAYALLEAKPSYVSFNQRELFAAIKSQYNELKSMGLEGSRGEPLSEAEPQAREALLGDPFSLFSLSPSTKVTLKVRAHPELGTQNNEKVYSDSLSLAVIGGLKEERLKAFLVACENALASGVPCVVFDSTGRLGVLKNFSPGKKWLEESGAGQIAPTFEKRVLGKDFHVDLSRIDPVFFAECLGLGNDAAAVLKALGSLPAKLDELARKIPLNSYAGQKTSRCIEVIGKSAPRAFNRSPSPNFAGATGASKTFYYDLSSFPLELRLLVIQSVLSPFESEVRESVLAAVEEDLGELPTSVHSLLKALPSKGGAVLVNTSSANVPFEFPQLHLLKFPEAVLQEGGQKTRFTLRNAFSGDKP
jgi:hypothetical protein